MRRFTPLYVVLGLAGAMFIACAAHSTYASTSGAEALARKLCDAWSSHDASVVDQLFAEQGVYEDVAAGQTFRGRDAIKGFLKQNFAAIPNFKVAVTKVFSTGGLIACEWAMSGTQTGDLPDLPATGKSFRVRGASVAQVQDGRIVHWTDYYDMFALLQQLGVLPNPALKEQ
jgi:steroid delta-isomerase-like uncharacterized protein